MEWCEDCKSEVVPHEYRDGNGVGHSWMVKECGECGSGNLVSLKQHEREEADLEIDRPPARSITMACSQRRQGDCTTNDRSIKPLH